MAVFFQKLHDNSPKMRDTNILIMYSHKLNLECFT